MITLHVLGSLDLRGPGGRHLSSPLVGAKRLALLAYLVMAGRRGYHRRDTLLGLFWPESDQARGRNALSNMLHQLRRSVGPDVLVARGHEEIGIARDVLWCDAVAFEKAVDDGRFAEALELYRGDLLSGLFIPGASSEFEHWLDGERTRLRGRAAEAAGVLLDQAEQAGNADAIRWARRSLELDPYDERAARRLIALLDRAGDRAGALRSYEVFARRLAMEFEAEPSAETRALMEQVRERTQPSARGMAAASAADWRSSGVADPGVEAPRDRQPRPSARAVAVLPFQNLTGGADAEPFAAGLHDDLLTELSRVSALDVIARTSVQRYRDTQLTVREIARELGVGTVVEGSVQTSGGRLRLNVQVIDAITGAHRWAERYDRELSAQSIFDLQGDLAQKIVAALRAELTAGEQRRTVERERTEDLEAYRLCVQGRALLEQRTPRAMEKSVGYFRSAIDRDEGYALAWSGLADALSMLEFYDHPPPAGSPGPMEAALRAVELGPDLGQARASLGIIRSIRQQGTAALADLSSAIELAPSHAEAHAWLGWVYLLCGEPAMALAVEARAVELDPLAPAFRAYFAEIQLANGAAHEALREAARARAVQPEYGLAHFIEGLALYHLERFREAERALETALGLVPTWGMPSHAEVHAVLAVIQASTGDAAAAKARLARIDGVAHPFSRGLVLAALGDVDGAFAAFDRVRDWTSFSTDHLRYFFPDVLAAVRSDPRHAALLRRVDDVWGGAARERAPVSPSSPVSA